MSENIVSSNWLHERLSSPDIAILDCSWHLPTANRNAKDEFQARHIPGAQFFDIDDNSDRLSSLPHMLPRPDAFSSAVRKLGVGDGKRVVCYDAAGLFSAARVWWMFRVFGHREVSVLDGGLPKWLAESRPVEEGPARSPQERHFTARYQAMMVADKSGARSAQQLVDARSPTRFRGEEPEPRAGVQPGHIPGSRNLHYARLLNADGTLKQKGDLKNLFSEAGVDIKQPVVTSCGSGVTAAILSLALSEIGVGKHSLYDGSWAEWGAAADTEKATGY
jgi:thiosulfate/3-mercaptopyruvate sulfurtransferase